MLFPLQTYLLFCTGAFGLILSPGPDFYYVASRGVSGGRGAGIASALGIGTGLIVHTLLAASGLSLLVRASPLLFNLLKWFGAAYLIWMGIGILRSGDELLAPGEKREFQLSQVFRQGVLTNVLNPKVALTFAVFVLPFVSTQRGNVTLQIVVLGCTLCALATTWFCVIGVFAGQLGGLLSKNKNLSRFARLFSGVVVTLLGCLLAISATPALVGLKTAAPKSP